MSRVCRQTRMSQDAETCSSGFCLLREGGAEWGMVTEEADEGLEKEGEGLGQLCLISQKPPLVHVVVGAGVSSHGDRDC